MPDTALGEKIASWTPKNKESLKSDLEAVTKVPLEVLRSTVDRIAKTYPACNTSELTALAAEQNNVADADAFSSFIAAFTFIWENMDGESPNALVKDLRSLELLSDGTSKILLDLLIAAEPYRDAAIVSADYIKIGAPLFADMRGTVDLRLRFHKTRNEYLGGRAPKELVGSQQVIMVNMAIVNADGEESTIQFVMDENDLNLMKRFVRNMERELDLSKSLLRSGQKGNG
jgi:hypothetical protein